MFASKCARVYTLPILPIRTYFLMARDFFWSALIHLYDSYDCFLNIIIFFYVLLRVLGIDAPRFHFNRDNNCG